MDEAVSMAQDAIGLMLKDCEVCPKPSLPSAIHVDAGDFVAMIPFDQVSENAKNSNVLYFETISKSRVWIELDI